MRPPVAAVHELVSALAPGDDLEAEHRAWTLRWLVGTDDVYRRIKPATPDPHLVSYVVPVDPASGGVLLGEHLLAGLWLPPGGHVEPDEHPADTARREAEEELGLRAAVVAAPALLTVTATVGLTAGHTDVSLWFPVRIPPGRPVAVDEREFRSLRWWTPAELATADPAGFDPHLGRFMARCAGAAAANAVAPSQPGSAAVHPAGGG